MGSNWAWEGLSNIEVGSLKTWLSYGTNYPSITHQEITFKILFFKNYF